MALPLACRRLNLAGVADLVEFRTDRDGETAYPVARPSCTVPMKCNYARKGFASKR
jgi:hypothetical protein